MRPIAAVWQRLPIILRAVLVGSFVMSMATVPCGILLRANFALMPAVPWSVPVVVIYLWLYWQYLSGKGWPQTTTEFRRTNLRANSLPGSRVAMGASGGRPGVGECHRASNRHRYSVRAAARLAVQSIFLSGADDSFLHCRSFGVGGRRGGSRMSRLYAGANQAAPRPDGRNPGRRYHILALSHASAFVNHWWMFLGRLWFYLAASAVFGTVAYLSGSILPGVVLHTVANLVGFGLVWWFESRAAFSTDGGKLDLFFWATCLTGLVSVIATLWSYRRLAVVVRALKASAGKIS